MVMAVCAPMSLVKSYPIAERLPLCPWRLLALKLASREGLRERNDVASERDVTCLVMSKVYRVNSNESERETRESSSRARSPHTQLASRHQSYNWGRLTALSGDIPRPSSPPIGIKTRVNILLTSKFLGQVNSTLGSPHTERSENVFVIHCTTQRK